MSNYDTVLFDFDGTIVDSTPAVLGAWKHTYDVLKPGQYDEARCLSTFGEHPRSVQGPNVPAMSDIP